MTVHMYFRVLSLFGFQILHENINSHKSRVIITLPPLLHAYNYVITLSSQLSGSYNSAELAKKQFPEDYPNTNIEVFDSKSASVGQTLIARKIKEHALQGDAFHEVVEKVNAYRDSMTTKFVLESLETLRKNGRLSNIKAIICSALNIKPIMTSTDEGEIDKLDQARGIKKALLKMIEVVVNEIKDPENCVLGISHCNNKERAIFVKDEILKYIKLKAILIVDTAGISSLYANDGGIIVCY